MSKNVILDAEIAVSAAVLAVHTARMFYDWEGSGERATVLKEVGQQLADIQCRIIELSNFKPEKLSEEHNV
jgi:hypothetical protein